MDINRALRNATQTGSVALGVKETTKAIASNKAKLVVFAANAPQEAVEQVEALAQTHKVPIYRFAGKNSDLGPACGKPFSVAILTVIEAGDSDVLQLARGA